MNKIAQKMLQHKKGIVALFAVLAVLCALLSRRVKVDYNMMHGFVRASHLPVPVRRTCAENKPGTAF